MANRLFVGLLLLLLVGLVGWSLDWFLRNFERQTEEVRGGYSATARRNPLLAAERFLQRLDLQVESLSGRGYLKQPPPEPGVLLVRDLGPSLPATWQRDLLDWVYSGGHLIVSTSHVPTSDEAQNRLLEELQIELVEQDEDDTGRGDPLEFRLGYIDEPFEVDFKSDRVLYTERDDTLERVAGGEGSHHLLGLAWGRGRVTLLSDIRFFDNSRIDEHDHARLLAVLVGDHQRAWLLYSSQMPSLIILVWRHAAWLIIGSLLLFMTWVWWLTYRSGPVLQRRERRRRSLLEHLQAGMEFRWRRDRAARLLQDSRERIEQRWLRSHPVLQAMGPAARCRWLAERTGLAGRSIELALYGDAPQQAAELVQISITQQRLLAALYPDSKME